LGLAEDRSSAGLSGDRGRIKLVAELGKEPQTPVDEAVRTTLAAFDCLEPSGAARAARAERLMFLA
jgi:hypothetical protein